MTEKKESLKVAFSTQKGGVGKTSLTVLLSSYLHYAKGYDVAVIDCDYPQHSIVEMRERDLKLVMEDEYYKHLAYNQFKKLNKKAYPVIESDLENAFEEASDVLEDKQTDFIFFDLPGTVINAALFNTLSQMDYIFIPISADRVVVESSLQFAITIQDTLITTGKSDIKGMYIVWNMVDGREKNELYQVYEDVITKLGFSILKTQLPDSKKFRREQSPTHKALFRSTVFPVDKLLLKGSKIDELTNEILGIVK